MLVVPVLENIRLFPLFEAFSLICPRRPRKGWESSGGGFAPLHRPFARPAFFMAGPRVTEVSLSGSTRRLNYLVFKVLRRSLVKAYQKLFSSESDWEYTLGGLVDRPGAFLTIV